MGTDLLIPDTNVLLDIIRGRAKLSGSTPPPATSAADASEISRLVASGDVMIGLHPLVRIEYERNVSPAEQTARQNYRETAKRLARLRVPDLPPDAIKIEHILANDRFIATQLIAQADELDVAEEDGPRADARYGRRQPPAHKGSSSTHDSRVLEAALRAARAHGHGTTWLLTRNTTEFEQDGQLHPQLADEYEHAGLRHGRSWRDYLVTQG